MAVMIGLLTDGGLFVGGVGTTHAEALGSACAVLGEDFEYLATLGMEEAIERVNDAVDDVEAAAPHLVAPTAADAGVGGATGSTGAATADAAEGAEAADLWTGSDGGGDEADRGREATAGEAPVPGQGADPQCSVCGVAITADRAAVSTEDYGKPQCRPCSPA